MGITSISGFTTHALEQLNARHISLDMAEYVLKNGREFPGHDDCFIKQGRIPEKQKLELRLVLNNLGDLVTACWRRSKNSLNIPDAHNTPTLFC